MFQALKTVKMKYKQVVTTRELPLCKNKNEKIIFKNYNIKVGCK